MLPLLEVAVQGCCSCLLSSNSLLVAGRVGAFIWMVHRSLSPAKNVPRPALLAQTSSSQHERSSSSSLASCPPPPRSLVA